MHRIVIRGGIAAAILAAAALLAGLAEANPLGVGAGEAGGGATGLLGWVNDRQQEFYRALTGALRSMRDGEGGVWILAGLSFAYGVFHAAGPGHGKAVISSYMLANEVALRRGVMLSFVSAMLQGLVAILLIGAVFLFLRGTSVSMQDASHFLEVASYALVAGFGAWLLWRKLRALRPQAGHAHDHVHDHDCGEGCGHAHAPDPALLRGARLDLRSAWGAVAAVGMRPCSGALIVLTFAFLNQLWAGGILSVFAMALGTAITVAVLASLAVGAKNIATRIAGGAGGRIHDAIEIAGALMVLVLGLLLLGASL
jgi:nickel/cobalt exporter